MNTPIYINSRDLNEAYFLVLQQCLLRGKLYNLKRSSTPAKRLELEFLSGVVHSPGTRPLIPIVPDGMSPPFDENYLNNYVQYLLTDEKQENEDYAYGEYVVSKLEEMVKYYKKHGQNKHCYISIGGSKSLDAFDNEGGKLPCLRGIDTNLIEGKLSFYVIFRSWNLLNGFPVNLAGIQIIKEYMTSSIGCEDGELYFSCLRAGITESRIPLAEQIVNGG